MNLFWQHEAWSSIEGCVSSQLLAGRISWRFNILSLSLCELAIYYAIKIHTNKHTSKMDHRIDTRHAFSLTPLFPDLNLTYALYLLQIMNVILWKGREGVFALNSMLI